jgi:hypothetical protein
MVPANTEAATKQITALQMRNLGYSYDAIADRLKYANRSGAWKAVQAALNRAVREPAREQRIIQAERLDILVNKCMAAVLTGDLDQVRNVLLIEKRRADLFGLDAKVGLEITGPDGGAVQTDVGQLLMERLASLATVNRPELIEAEVTSEAERLGLIDDPALALQEKIMGQ